MKRTKSALIILLILVGISIAVYTQVNAKEDIVAYLNGRFKEKNIPVVEITVLEESPLRLQIVVQNKNPWVTTDDQVILNEVDREVFIFALQNGYFVKSYIRILQDREGRELDRTEQGTSINEIITLALPQAALSDNATQKMVIEQVAPLLEEYKIDAKNITFDVSSAADGSQTLTLQVKTSSMDDAANAAFFLWSLPHFSLIPDLNTQGAKIALYRAKVIDENNQNLFDSMYDFQLNSGSWTQDKRIPTIGGEGPPQ